jgi:hypothetical protein
MQKYYPISPIRKYLLDQKLKYTMRPGRLGIHMGLPNRPIPFSPLHKIHRLLKRRHLGLTQPLNINPICFALMND